MVSHRVILSGRSADFASGLGAETRSYDEPGPGVAGAGNAGNVSVDVGRTGSVQMYKGAGISTRSTSTGKGGNIDVKGGNLVIDSRGFREIPPFVVNFNTGILARGEAAGAGGDIHVAVGRLRLLNQGAISAATAAANQKGGDITISADDAGSTRARSPPLQPAPAGTSTSPPPANFTFAAARSPRPQEATADESASTLPPSPSPMEASSTADPAANP